MNRQFLQLFRTHTLNHIHLKQAILALFPTIDPQQRYNYDQFLFLFDTNGVKADRSTVQQLLRQVQDIDKKTTLSSLVDQYIENVETSKMCLRREEHKLDELKEELESIKDRRLCFVFMKVLGVSIHSRFTHSPNFEYQIVPSDVPPVLLSNAVNVSLNHQFTLQMEQDEFELVFKESGVEIFRWGFPDQPDIQEGEYHRLIRTENVDFEAKIKYIPRSQDQRKLKAQAQIARLQENYDRQATALKQLCSFQPFLQKQQGEQVEQDGKVEGGTRGVTDTILGCTPFLQNHVRTLYYLLIVGLLLDAWVSSVWSIEFLDMMACVYGMGLLLDLKSGDIGSQLTILVLTFAVLTVKSIWAAVQNPFFEQKPVSRWLIVFAVIVKIVIMIALAITLIRRDEVAALKIKTFGSDQPDQKEGSEVEPKIDIWSQVA